MQKKKILICAALIACNLAFIWGNSLLPGETSGEISGGLLLWLKQTFPFLTGMGEYLLRKLGHFSEFACLGLLLCRLFFLIGERGIHGITSPLFCGMTAAAVDETIQIFVPGRGSSLIDVWIDTAGVCTGIIVLLLGQAILRTIHRKDMNK